MKAAMSNIVQEILYSNDKDAKRELRKPISSCRSVGDSRTIHWAGRVYQATVISANEKMGCVRI